MIHVHFEHDGSLKEEFLIIFNFFASLLTKTTTEDFKTVNNYITNKYDLDIKSYVSVCFDGSAAMKGRCYPDKGSYPIMQVHVLVLLSKSFAATKNINRTKQCNQQCYKNSFFWVRDYLLH